MLNKRGVPYKEISVTDAADLAQLEKLSGDHAVPVLTVGHAVHKGFDREDYKTALDNAGYPPESMLPLGAQVRQFVTKTAPKPAPPAAKPAPATASPEAADTGPPK